MTQKNTNQKVDGPTSIKPEDTPTLLVTALLKGVEPRDNKQTISSDDLAILREWPAIQ